MAMQQCPNGHLYDDAKNSSCPYCSSVNSVNVTVPLVEDQPQAAMNAFPQTVPLDGFVPEYVSPQPHIANDPVAQPVGQPAPDAFPSTKPIDDGFKPTMYVSGVLNDKGVEEVRGWLVCLEGEKRGMDFRIHGGNNTIGRGNENDIKIDFDETISKGVNATITYDIKNNKFFIFLREAKNNIYVNDQLLMTPIELKDYDIIEIGSTKMILRSLCNDQFNWENSAKDE